MTRIESGVVRGVILMENEGASGIENDVLDQEPVSFVVGSVGKIEVGALRGVNLIEKEGGSEVENDLLEHGPESFVVVSVDEIEVEVVEEDEIEAGAVWSVVLIENELGGSGVENDVLG